MLPIAALAAIGTIFCLPASDRSDEDEGEAAEDDPMVEEIVVEATYRDTQLVRPMRKVIVLLIVLLMSIGEILTYIPSCRWMPTETQN